MSLWKIQAGKYGEQEAALNHNIVAVGWKDIPDLSEASSREEIASLYRRLHAGKTSQQVITAVAQIWTFRTRMQINDWVVVPLKSQAAFAVGKISSGYEYRTDLGDDIRHTRRMNWVSKSVPRSAFDQDLLYSFRAAMTICEVSRNDAESRVKALVLERYG